MRQGALVARHFPMYALLIGIAPAGMHPDLGVHADELAIERLGEELEIGIRAVRLLGAHMVRRFLHLDQRAAGGGQVAQLRVHDVAEIEDHRLVVVVELVPKHRRQRGGADGAELHRPVRHALRDLPQRGVFQGPARELLTHHAGLIGLLHLPQYLAGAQTVARHPAPRGVAVATDAAETLDGIKEPGLAAHGQIEAAVAVGHDIEPCRLLLGDDAGDRVEILLAEQGLAERGLERSAGQAAIEPKRSRIGAGDGGGQNHIARDGEHGWPPGLRLNDSATACRLEKGSCGQRLPSASGRIGSRLNAPARRLTKGNHDQPFSVVAAWGRFPSVKVVPSRGLVTLRDVLQHAHVAFNMPSGVTGRAQLFEGSQRLVDLRSTGAQ